jgi:hypothetical protein
MAMTQEDEEGIHSIEANVELWSEIEKQRITRIVKSKVGKNIKVCHQIHI